LLVLTAGASARADLLINEILFNPPLADSTNEYVELRGTPNSLLPAGTWLLNVEGDANGNPGTIQNLFDLSGLRVGQNGYLVLLQKNHRYTPNPLATVVTNSDHGDGWGSGSSSSMRHRGEGGQTELENPSCTFLLVQTPNPPSIGDDLDQDDDGELDSSVTSEMLILDAVGILDSDGAGDMAYGRINFRRDNAPGNGASVPPGSTVVPLPFTPGYIGRNGDSNGWDRTHWVASDNLGGAAPRWFLEANSSTTRTTNTFPFSRSRAALNHIGGPNFGARPPPAVLIKQSSNSTIVVEGGLRDSYTINLALTPSGAVTTRVDAAFPLQISTDGRTFTNTRTLVFTTTASKRITVRVPDDRLAGPSPLRALITHTVVGTRDPLRYPTNTIILPVSVAVYDNDPVILSEAKVNPPGVDMPFEYIELKGPPGMTITNLHILSIKGEADDAGRIQFSLNLTGQAFGTNGLLIIASPGNPYTFGPGTTVVESLTPGTAEGVLDNQSLSLLLVGSAASIPQGVDVDNGDNGILEGLPENAVIMDAVGWTDREIGAQVYGGVDLTQHGFTPDAAIRVPGNVAPLSAAAWMVGALAGSTGDSIVFDLHDVSSNLPPGSILTPGTVNRTAPRVSKLVPLSHVIGDPDNPSVTFTVSDEETPASSLVVTAVSTNQSVVPDTNLVLKHITGSKWTLDIEPVGVGYSDILIRVNDGSFIGIGELHYAASAPGRPDTVWLTHVSDASTAIPIDANWMLVGDDENQILRVYSRTRSGPPARTFDVNPFLALTDFYDDGTPKEVDIEASTRVGNRLFWIGSHSHSADTLERTNRARLFATDLSGSGSNVALRVLGHYDFLKLDLIDWDARNLHGKGANYYGLADSGAVGVDPKAPDGSGFNIEGLCMAPGSSTTAYLGFRAPLVPPPNRAAALIVPVLNFTALATNRGAPGSAVFGTPIELNLGGRGIRSIEGAGTNYLIVAGPPGGGTNLPPPADFRLFTWSGKPTDPPRERAADLAGLNPEGIVGVPSGVWTTNTQFQLISDNGTTVYYGDGKEAKHLRIREFKKFRADTVRLGAVVQATPSLRAIKLTTDGARLIWLAERGARYRVQCKFSLSQPEWRDLGVEVIADGPLASQTVSATNPQCFYRLVVLP
jgi:hypothetical protein